MSKLTVGILCLLVIVSVLLYPISGVENGDISNVNVHSGIDDIRLVETEAVESQECSLLFIDFVDGLSTILLTIPDISGIVNYEIKDKKFIFKYKRHISSESWTQTEIIELGKECRIYASNVNPNTDLPTITIEIGEVNEYTD